MVFWDRPHVTSRASNSIELHPILDFACFSLKLELALAQVRLTPSGERTLAHDRPRSPDGHATHNQSRNPLEILLLDSNHVVSPNGEDRRVGGRRFRDSKPHA